MNLHFCSSCIPAEVCEDSDLLSEYTGKIQTTVDGTQCVPWKNSTTGEAIAFQRQEDFAGKVPWLDLLVVEWLCMFSFVVCDGGNDGD